MFKQDNTGQWEATLCGISQRYYVATKVCLRDHYAVRGHIGGGRYAYAITTQSEGM
jgi:hypothetical protein